MSGEAPKSGRFKSLRMIDKAVTRTASWPNILDRFFRNITQSQMPRGVFQDLEQLVMGIGVYIDKPI
jgi:hypothetical protein